MDSISSQNMVKHLSCLESYFIKRTHFLSNKCLCGLPVHKIVENNIYYGIIEMYFISSITSQGSSNELNI